MGVAPDGASGPADPPSKTPLKDWALKLVFALVVGLIGHLLTHH